MRGTVFDIQRFCVHDGPGIRTVVFLKGCPLRCVWCHNPEGLSGEPQVMLAPEKCIGCGECVRVCSTGAQSLKGGIRSFDPALCAHCMRCTEGICSTKAVFAAGRVMEDTEVMEKVMRDAEFYRESGGGITLSGGEPFFRADFALELLRLAKKNGITTAAETCGTVPLEVMKKAAALCDTFLFDVKLTNEEDHLRYTGASRRMMLENLRYLDSVSADIVLRCPMIPGINTNEAHYEAIGRLAESLSSVREVNIMPYHDFGVSKYRKLSETAPFVCDTMDGGTAEKIKNEIEKHTDVPVRVM